MKNETAMREIESLDYYLQNHTDDYSEESHTAMMMAISALSENKGDFISRQAVLDGIDKYIEKAQSTGTIDDFISFEELVVKILPSVENKGEDRPKGHWIYWSDSPFRWECDKCGGLFKTDFNFCPNCGADMRGE